MRPMSYEKDVHKVQRRGRDITIENLFPIMTEDESILERKKIEEGLYDIFEKYTGNS